MPCFFLYCLGKLNKKKKAQLLTGLSFSDGNNSHCLSSKQVLRKAHIPLAFPRASAGMRMVPAMRYRVGSGHLNIFLTGKSDPIKHKNN